MAHGQAGPGLESEDGSAVEVVQEAGRKQLLILDPQSLSELTLIRESLQNIELLLNLVINK